ncbi:H/ACA ribonucleoprotein complex non-core subunit NAF1 [Nymphon striatum]|nr:H/ACA ribonucleoprotein complex non-core subunit NAF1 [Nymphon striatum]
MASYWRSSIIASVIREATGLLRGSLQKINSKIKPRKKFVIEEGFEKLPPVEQLDINIDHSHLKELGNVSGIVEIWDVLGLVTAPMYGVRFNTAEEISECNIKVGDKIYYAPNNPDYTEQVGRVIGIIHTSFDNVCTQQLPRKFSKVIADLNRLLANILTNSVIARSGRMREEDFSDDEVEKKKKSKKSNNKRKPAQDSTDVVHHRQNKNLHAKKTSFDQSNNSNVWHKKNHQSCSYPQAPQTQNNFELKSPQLQQTHPYSQSQQTYCQSPQTWPQSQPIHPQFQPTHPRFQQTLPQFSMARPPHPSGLPRPQFNSHKNSHQPHFPNNHQNYDNSGDVNSHMFPAQRFHNPYPSASPYNYASVGAYPGNPFALHPSPVNSLTDCQTPVHQTTNNNNMRNTYVYPSNSFRPRQTHPRYNN